MFRINHKQMEGFTLVELMVSITIAVLIMGIVIYSYSTFNDNLALSAASQELAIGVRQAGVYGLSVKEVAVGGGQFNSAYGVYINPINSQTDYYLFVDKNTNGLYDVGSGCGSGSTECINKFIFRNGIKISTICDGVACPPSGAESLQITFLRPSPDANINFINSGGAIIGSSSIGKVILVSPKGKTQIVTIQSTGQISVQ